MSSDPNYALCQELAERLNRRAPRIERLMDGLATATSRQSVQPLVDEITLLEAATRLAGVCGVQPLLGTLRQLLGHWPAGEDVDRTESVAMVGELWAVVRDQLRSPDPLPAVPEVVARARMQDVRETRADAV